jgi:outer membrane protein
MTRGILLGIFLPIVAVAQLNHPIPPLSEKKEDNKEIGSISLEKSIKFAIEAASSVIKASGESEISAQQLMQGYLQFAPNLAATGAYSRARGNSLLYQATPTYVDTVNHGANYAITTTLNIFNGLSDFAGLKAALNRKDAADLTLKRAKQQIALDVAQSFLQVILDQQLVRIAKKNLVASQDREKLLTEQTRVGVRNLADLFRQQAQTSADESFMATQENKQRTDELQLLQKLRLDTSVNYRLVEPKLEEEGKGDRFDDEEKLIKMAVDNRVDLTAVKERAKAASWDVTSARASYFPRLDFGASMAGLGRILDEQFVAGADVVAPFGDQRTIEDQLQHEIVYTVGVTLTWNIFDRWTTRVNTERARVNATNARVDSEDFQRQVVAEARQAWGDYRTVLQQLESSKKGLQAAQKAYEVVQGRYQVGSASFVDLTTAQAALVQAEASRAQAVIAFALQTRTMETVLGTVNVD